MQNNPKNHEKSRRRSVRKTQKGSERTAKREETQSLVEKCCESSQSTSGETSKGKATSARFSTVTLTQAPFEGVTATILKKPLPKGRLPKIHETRSTVDGLDVQPVKELSAWQQRNEDKKHNAKLSGQGEHRQKGGKLYGAEFKGRTTHLLGDEILSSIRSSSEFDNPVFESKREFDAWQRKATRRDLTFAICSDFDTATRLLSLGKWASRRAGLYLVYWYGVQASETALNDAASDSVARVIHALTNELFSMDGKSAIECFETFWQDKTFRRYVAREASNGAWNSLRSWSNDGLSGERERMPVFKVAVESEQITESQLNEAIEAMREHLTSREAITAKEKRQAIRRIYRNGFFTLKRRLTVQLAATRNGVLREGEKPLQPCNVAKMLNSALKRCRVLGRVILGDTLLIAAKGAGFTGGNPVNAFWDSCKDSDFFGQTGIVKDGHSLVSAKTAKRLQRLKERNENLV